MDDEGLRLPRLSDHEELGEEGDALQVDGECPEDFHHRGLMVEPQSQDEAGYEEELYSQAVVVGLIFGLENKHFLIDLINYFKLLIRP